MKTLSALTAALILACSASAQCRACDGYGYAAAGYRAAAVYAAPACQPVYAQPVYAQQAAVVYAQQAAVVAAPVYAQPAFAPVATPYAQPAFAQSYGYGYAARSAAVVAAPAYGYGYASRSAVVVGQRGFAAASRSVVVAQPAFVATPLPATQVNVERRGLFGRRTNVQVNNVGAAPVRVRVR